MRVFADTSALYALLDAENTGHRAVAGQWDQLHSGGHDLLTTNYVLVETLSLLQRRIGTSAARDFVESIAPLLQVDWVAAETHGRAVDGVLAANRRDLSLVDCVSFEVMRRRGIRPAFTLDEHFREQGFECMP